MAVQSTICFTPVGAVRWPGGRRVPAPGWRRAAEPAPTLIHTSVVHTTLPWQEPQTAGTTHSVALVALPSATGNTRYSTLDTESSHVAELHLYWSRCCDLSGEPLPVVAREEHGMHFDAATFLLPLRQLYLSPHRSATMTAAPTLSSLDRARLAPCNTPSRVSRSPAASFSSLHILPSYAMRMGRTRTV